MLPPFHLKLRVGYLAFRIRAPQFPSKSKRRRRDDRLAQCGPRRASSALKGQALGKDCRETEHRRCGTVAT